MAPENVGMPVKIKSIEAEVKDDLRGGGPGPAGLESLELQVLARMGE